MRTKTDWTPWTFNRENYTLEHPNSYYIDLERCRTSAETLDRIFQISKKSWATPEVVSGMLNALNDLLRPQATLCSFGDERGPIKPVQVIEDHINEASHEFRPCLYAIRIGG